MSDRTNDEDLLLTEEIDPVTNLEACKNEGVRMTLVSQSWKSEF